MISKGSIPTYTGEVTTKEVASWGLGGSQIPTQELPEALPALPGIQPTGEL